MGALTDAHYFHGNSFFLIPGAILILDTKHMLSI